MYITDKKSADKAMGLLWDARTNLKDKKQIEAIDATMDLIDELLIEGRFE